MKVPLLRWRGSAVRPKARERVSLHFPRLAWRDLGVYPLLMVLPFMYFPRLVEGDTQPWIFLTAAIALFTFRADEFARRRDLPVVALALVCLLTYALRSQSSFLLLRSAYMYVTFITLWLVCRREHGDLFPNAIRYCIVLWFLVGLYEFANVSLGHGLGVPDLFAGRVGIAGRSGVPGMAAEPSFYGSLSAVQMMYLLAENDRKNRYFIFMAAASVVLSGSALAMLMLVFPIMKLNFRLRLAAFVGVPLLVIVSSLISSAGLLARLSFLTQGDVALDSVLLDISLNIRAGNIYFTLYKNLFQSLTLSSPISYLHDYSVFAKNSGIWQDPFSEYTLPAAGELIYGAGIFGLLLILSLMYIAQAEARTAWGKCEKIVFVAACLLNPITLANPLLIMYIQKHQRHPARDAAATPGLRGSLPVT